MMKRKFQGVLRIKSDYSNFTKDVIKFIPGSKVRQRQGYKFRMENSKYDNKFYLFKVYLGPCLYFMILEMSPCYEEKI